MTLDFDEGDELRDLRAAVADLGLPVRARLVPGAGPHRRQRPGAVGRGRRGRVPRRQPARGARRRGAGHGRAGGRAGGARRGRLPAADDGGQPGHLRHGHRPLRHPRAVRPLAAGHRRRLADHGLRHHRARRGVQQPRDRHGRPPGRRRVGAVGAEDLDQRGRRRRRRPRRGQAGRLGAGHAAAGPLRRPHRCAGADPDPHPDGAGQPGQPVHPVPGRRPVARRRPGRLTGRRDRAAVRRPEPRAGDGGGLLAGHRPARAGPGRRLRPGPAGAGAPRSVRTRASRTRWPPRRWRWSWPG